MTTGSSTRDRTRSRIVAAATDLLVRGGREGVSTRAVCALAEVQAPTLYRLFGDKQGLIDAVVDAGYADHLAAQRELEPGPDGVQDLRRAFDVHVGFGLAHPLLYALIYGEPREAALPAAAVTTIELLKGRVRRVAEEGRLRVPQRRAVQLLHAGGVGATLTLLHLPERERDPRLAEVTRDSLFRTIVTDDARPAEPDSVAAAVHLQAVLPAAEGLSPGERSLLGELLERLAQPGTSSCPGRHHTA